MSLHPEPAVLAAAEALRSARTRRQPMARVSETFGIDGLAHGHHRLQILAELVAACANAELSGMDAVEVMFARDLDAHQLPFALGEAIAHLHTLWHQGQLKRSVDREGIYRFKAKAEWIRS